MKTFISRCIRDREMEEWAPLFDIFLNSPTPESEASLWLQQSFNAASSPTITPTAFLSLLTHPADAINSSPPPPPPQGSHRIMWMETLPSLVQARILSFLACDYGSFSSLELSRMARSLLSRDMEVDFWVRKGAHNLLDKMSAHTLELTRSMERPSTDGSIDDEFYAVPTWLEDVKSGGDHGFGHLLPWLPLSLNDLKIAAEHSAVEVEVVQEPEDITGENSVGSEGGSIDLSDEKSYLDPDLQRMAANLNAQMVNHGPCLDTVRLAGEIRQLCLGRRKGDSLALLELIEPWKADEEIVAVLLSKLLNGDAEEEEDELGWPSHVLCSTVLPKLLVLEEPVSRVIMTATMEFCKLHQRAAEYALLFPLILIKGGINSSVCDVATRVIKDCLHPAHTAAFCQKLLSGAAEVRSFICLPCHQLLVSDELVWTEATFTLFQNIFNLNVHLTKDSVDHLAYKVHGLAKSFARSLKFGNFLLCFVTKCSPLLKPHKQLLTEAANCTSTLVTKSVLSKLDKL